jgi:hypothetical protein
MSLDYTGRLFAAELLVELECGLIAAEPPFSLVRLGRWAFGRRLMYQGRLEAGLIDKMMTIELLEEGAEFAMSIDEIRAFAKEML